jgi:hypothetical protein
MMIVGTGVSVAAGLAACVGVGCGVAVAAAVVVAAAVGGAADASLLHVRSSTALATASHFIAACPLAYGGTGSPLSPAQQSQAH